jgi:hypothetical protein
MGFAQEPLRARSAVRNVLRKDQADASLSRLVLPFDIRMRTDLTAADGLGSERAENIA